MTYSKLLKRIAFHSFFHSLKLRISLTIFSIFITAICFDPLFATSVNQCIHKYANVCCEHERKAITDYSEGNCPSGINILHDNGSYYRELPNKNLNKIFSLKFERIRIGTSQPISGWHPRNNPVVAASSYRNASFGSIDTEIDLLGLYVQDMIGSIDDRSFFQDEKFNCKIYGHCLTSSLKRIFAALPLISSDIAPQEYTPYNMKASSLEENILYSRLFPILERLGSISPEIFGKIGISQSYGLNLRLP